MVTGTLLYLPFDEAVSSHGRCLHRAERATGWRFRLSSLVYPTTRVLPARLITANPMRSRDENHPGRIEARDVSQRKSPVTRVTSQALSQNTDEPTGPDLRLVAQDQRIVDKPIAARYGRRAAL